MLCIWYFYDSVPPLEFRRNIGEEYMYFTSMTDLTAKEFLFSEKSVQVVLCVGQFSLLSFVSIVSYWKTSPAAVTRQTVRPTMMTTVMRMMKRTTTAGELNSGLIGIRIDTTTIHCWSWYGNSCI